MTKGSDTLANVKENIGGEKQFTKYFPVLDHATDKMLLFFFQAEDGIRDHA